MTRSGPRTLAAVMLLITVACLPVAVALTFLLMPLWRHVEEAHDVESVGHSGPAAWCYVATYAVLVVVCLGFVCLRRRGSD